MNKQKHLFNFNHKSYLDENNNILGFNYDNFWLMCARGICRTSLNHVAESLGNEIIGVSQIEKCYRGESLDFLKLDPIIRGTLYHYPGCDEIAIDSLEEKKTKGFLEWSMARLGFLTCPINSDFQERSKNYFLLHANNYLNLKTQAQFIGRDGDQDFNAIRYAVFLSKTGKTREEAILQSCSRLGIKPFLR